MSDSWLEIPDEHIDASRIMKLVQARIARRGTASLPEETGNPVTIAQALWREMVQDTTSRSAPNGHTHHIQPCDCDIVPRQYVIDWRTPILGPIHAMVRRIINAEIRRYLLSSLEKQSHFNRQVLRLVGELAEENERLQREIEDLRAAQE